ncbi:hypothetical protein QUF76_06900 [Desulfobacterales bacterium HSG16]|nr:hypothetical protein [Desulfobacterales bacterium HSG16]
MKGELTSEKLMELARQFDHLFWANITLEDCIKKFKPEDIAKIFKPEDLAKIFKPEDIAKALKLQAIEKLKKKSN